MIYPFNDKRLVERWKETAVLLPETSWNLCTQTIQAMVRHQVAVYNHRTGLVSLTDFGRETLI